MAVNNVFWSGGEGYDIHVLAGTTSRTLDDLLAIDHGTPSTVAFANAMPVGVATTVFGPEFAGHLPPME